MKAAVPLAAACAWLAVLGATTTARGQCDPQEVEHLFGADGAGFDELGLTVAISGDADVVGAHRDDTPGGTNAGSAFVFQLNGAPSILGDLNDDGVVNTLDLGILRNDWTL